MQKYKITIIVKDYMRIDAELKPVEAKLKLEYDNFEDVQNVLGYLTGGTTDEIVFELQRKVV